MLTILNFNLRFSTPWLIFANLHPGFPPFPDDQVYFDKSFDSYCRLFWRWQFLTTSKDLGNVNHIVNIRSFVNEIFLKYLVSMIEENLIIQQVEHQFVPNSILTWGKKLTEIHLLVGKMNTTRYLPLVEFLTRPVGPTSFNLF